MAEPLQPLEASVEEITMTSFSIVRWISALDKKTKANELIASNQAPLVSIIVTTYKTPEDFLVATLESILSQTYTNWEACIVDDGSQEGRLEEILNEYARHDPRIHVKVNKSNYGISAATNSAITLAKGQYLAFLDHDDELMPDAIELCVRQLICDDSDAVYTDQVTVDPTGSILHQFHKPDWSPEYFRHVMYVGHLLVVRHEIVKQIGGFLSKYDGVQDYEFFLRLTEKTARISHVAKVLYKWKAIPGSLATATDAKIGISDLQAEAVKAHLDRCGIEGIAVPHKQFAHRCRVIPQLKHHPKVSIIIPTKDQPKLIEQCLASIFQKTTYPAFEVVIIDTGTTDEDALKTLSSYPVKVLKYSGLFNFSAACNLGAKHAAGDIFLFLNNDTEVISGNWLENLALHFIEKDVGVVGALMLYPNGGVQHAGVVIGARGTADHVMRHFPAESDGYAGSLSCPREVSAVTGACLSIRREIFSQVGGFSELYGTHYQDVDLCLKVRQLQYRCIFTPEAKLVHHESPSRGSRYDFLDRLLFIDSWKETIAQGDQYYSRFFSLQDLDYSAAGK